MPNLVKTDIDNGSVLFDGGSFSNEVVTVGGAVTLLEGTILARDSSTLKLVPFVKGGVTNGNGIPVALLTYETASAGAGDVSVRAMIGGRVRQERLVIDADGDASNVDGAVLDQLRSFGIVPISSEQLAEYDN